MHELAHIKLDDGQLKSLVKKLNAEPRETFSRHKPGWQDKGDLPEDKQRENELYDAWLASLKPGDVVFYSWWSQYSGGRRFSTIKSRTKTGMLRLEDDSLVEKTGRVKGEHRYLQPYTEEYRAYDQRKKILSKLKSMTFDHLTNEGLALVIHAIQQAEAMLPKLLEDSEK